MTASHPLARPSCWPAVLVLVVVGATIAAFLPALEGRFLDWDDRNNFVENPHYRGLGWPQLRWMFTTPHLGHYIPVAWMTLGLDYLLWGLDPFGYHLTNLLLHAVNAALVYLLAVRLLALALPAAAPSGLAIHLGAGLAALLFSVHPLRAESVAWITERRDVLSGCFYLLALLLYLRAVTAPEEGLRRGGSYWGSVACFGLALLSKSMAVSLPVVLLLLDVYPLRRLAGAPGRWLAGPARAVVMEKIPFVLLSLAASVGALLALFRTDNATPLDRMGLLERTAISLYALAFYVWKSVVPANLSPIYPLPEPLDPWAWPFLLSGAVVASIAAAALVLRRRWPALLAAWIAYVVVLLPVLGIVHNGHQIAADRYTYLSCVGWAVLAGAGLASLWARRALPATRALRIPTTGVALIAVAVLGFLTWNQVRVWRDSESLWSHALAIRPSAIAHGNLGLTLALKGDVAPAIEHYREALRISPRAADVHNNLGIALMAQDRPADALQHYREALKLRPRHAEAHNNLGLALARAGQLQPAIEHYREALRIRPHYAEAHTNLGAALDEAEAGDEALRHLREALRLRPDSATAHNNLGVFLARRGEVAAATPRFRDAVRIGPGSADAHNNLGLALAQQGELAPAAEHFREALRLRPDFRSARQNLDRALGELRARGSRSP
jgi:Flp pilus assembly protein TadD